MKIRLQAPKVVPALFFVVSLGQLLPGQAPNGARSPRAPTGALRGSNDSSFPLALDPVVSYSTFLGGSSDDVAYATAVDAIGNMYIAGYTASTDLHATTGAYATTYPGGTTDIFVSKFDPSGAVIYTTYLGGSGDDVAYGLAVDSAGNAYITGSTTSTDFPVTAGAYKHSYQGGGSDAFLTVLNAAGSALLYSTYIGGSGDDIAYGIALNSLNEATLVGSTDSLDFPFTSGVFRTTNSGGITDAFVTRVNSAGTALVYSTYLGGSGEDVGYAIALDSSGNAYVTGYTESTDFPTTAGVAQTKNAGIYDAFVTALNSTGTALIYSTFLGGSDQDYGLGIALDAAANAYITGYTASTDYPTASGALQTSNGGGYDAVVTKLTSSGTLAYSTYLGGAADEFGLGIVVDSGGNAYITGDTASTNFPSASPVQSGLTGSFDAFVSSINATGTVLNYSTWIGGSAFQTGYGIALGPPGAVYVAGYTTSTDFPVSATAAQATQAGGSDAILFKLAIQPAAAFLDQNRAPALTFNGSTTFPDAGGYLIGAPGLAQASNGDVYVVGLDGAGGVHLNSYSLAKSAWNGWQYSGGILDTSSGLTAAIDPKGVVWFTGRDIGNRFWINSWNGASFGGWILVANGIFAADSVPQITVTSDGTIWIVGKDIGGRIWSNSYSPTNQTFSGWVDRQAIMIGQPSIAAGQDGFVYVAVRSVASESPVYITQIPAANGANASCASCWWLNGGGLIDTDPQITSQGGTVYLMAEADGNTVYLLTFSEATQTYGAWNFTNGILNSATIAAAAGNVFVAGLDGGDRIYWYSVTGDSWFFADGAGVSSTVLAGGK